MGDFSTAGKKAVLSPTLDFLLLGGASLIIFPLVMWALPVQTLQDWKIIPAILAVVIALEFVGNFPHFMYSYLLMYKGFIQKIKGQIDPPLQKRYVFAGIIVPICIAGIFAFACLQRNKFMLGMMPNIMFLTAGWHYAKQGFGMLVATSIYQKVYYNLWERRVLLINAHLIWIYAWTLFNTGDKIKEIFGVTFYTLGLPLQLPAFIAALAIFSSVAALITFTVKYYSKTAPPLTGVTAYVASIYLWIILRFAYGFDQPIHPIVLFIPFLHSIQYMAIVIKMKMNETAKGRISKRDFLAFIVWGIISGAAIFYLVPNTLDGFITYDKNFYGASLFLFMVMISINIHHYFIDNVIWRRESSEAKDYLFSVS